MEMEGLGGAESRREWKGVPSITVHQNWGASLRHEAESRAANGDPPHCCGRKSAAHWARVSAGLVTLSPAPRMETEWKGEGEEEEGLSPAANGRGGEEEGLSPAARMEG